VEKKLHSKQLGVSESIENIDEQSMESSAAQDSSIDKSALKQKARIWLQSQVAVKSPVKK